MDKELIVKSEFETTEMLKYGEIDVYGCVRLMYDLIQAEKYEVCEGIKRAVERFGIRLEIPETEQELKELIQKMEYDKKAFEEGLIRIL